MISADFITRAARPMAGSRQDNGRNHDRRERYLSIREDFNRARVVSIAESARGMRRRVAGLYGVEPKLDRPADRQLRRKKLTPGWSMAVAEESGALGARTGSRASVVRHSR
jgi:hypothetical protein